MATPSPFNRGYSGGLAARNLPMPAGFTSTPPQMQPPLPPSPMGPMDSPANRSYGGGLAGRPAVPVGRSSYDLNRIAQQQFRRTKDPSMLLQMDTRNRYYPPVGGWPSQQAQPQPRPMLPPIQPGGQASASVAVPSAEIGTAGAAPSTAAPATIPAPAAAGFVPPMLPMPQAPGGGLDITKPLPPSTLGGGTGVPAAPAFQVQNVGSFEVLTQNTPDGPKFYNARVTPDQTPKPGMTSAGYRMLDDYNRKNPDRPLVFTGEFEPNGQPVLAPAPVQPPMETVTIDPDGTERRSFKRPMGQQPAPAPAAAPGGAPTNGAAPFTTPGGVKVQLVPDQASAMQTGQMPNVAYANDMPPVTREQAVAEYTRTGDDTLLRQYMAANPSQQARLAQRESQVWQQLLNNVTADTATAEQVQAAAKNREDYIRKHNVTGSITEGSHALDWERKNPQLAALLNRGMTASDDRRKLLNYANQLNAERTGTSMMPVPPPLPTLAQLEAQVQQERLDRRSGLSKMGSTAQDALAATGQTMGQIYDATGRVISNLPGQLMAPLRQPLQQFLVGQPGPGPKELELRRRQSAR